MNWLLLVVLVILVGNALIGRKVGFIKTVFSLCSMIVAIFLTVLISPTVNDLMKGNEKFYSYVEEKAGKIVQAEAEETNEEAEETKDEAENLSIGKLPLPQSIKDTLIKNKDSKVNGILAAGGLKDYIAKYLANIIIKALAFIVTFIIILILLWAICFALNIISKLPILNSINKTAGLLAGLVHGLVIVWIFFILLTVFGGTGFGQDTLKMIGESQVLSFIYNNNLLLRFVTSATKIFL